MLKLQKVVSLTAIAALFAAGAVCAETGHSHGVSHHPHWTYQGNEGPSHWGELEHDFATCAVGHQQSPINIDTKAVAAADLAPITVDYKSSALKIANNGHTIQVSYDPGSFITVGSKRFELVQFHFHAPSEHTVDGKPGDMVVHLVHKSSDGSLGVIDLMFDKGTENSSLASIWSNMPKSQGEVTVAGATINAADLLPVDLHYYGYTGSLTTPPCTEGVTWMVLSHRRSVSDAQLGAYTAIFPVSARPVQPLHTRTVHLSK